MSLIDQQTAAIRGSIGKWTLIVDAIANNREFFEYGSNDCECCLSFYHGPEGENCTNCPVANATGQPMCHGTPYDQWTDFVGDTIVFTPDDATGKYPPELITLASKEQQLLIAIARGLENKE